MSKDTRRDTRPFSIRLTDTEKQVLLERAGRQPLGTYVRDTLLADGAARPRRKQTLPIQDHQALARVLGALGKSRLSSNLNQLAKAVHMGVLPITEETEAEIADACETVRSIRADLLRALGLQESGS